MRNRFSYEKEASLPNGLNIIINSIIMIIMLFLFVGGINYTGHRTIARQQESLENAINRDIAQCYALEGAYPPSLEYIKEHYGLTYDENTFFVDYQPIASNLYPDVTIILIR